MDYKFEYGDKVTFISGGNKHMTGLIFNRFPKSPLVPENRYAIEYGKSRRGTIIAESLITKLGILLL